jgi:large subunit ribosomal protein L15
MTINRRKKNVKQRGSKTHGYGSMKKHRGAGSRGGRGNAGSGKRGDVKKPSFRHEGRNGRHGFSSPLINPRVTKINLALITQRLAIYVQEGQVKKSKDVFTLDLASMGYDKLLGSGKIAEKLDVTVYMASARAISKIEAAGGKVTVLKAGDDFEAHDE